MDAIKVILIRHELRVIELIQLGIPTIFHFLINLPYQQQKVKLNIRVRSR